MGEGFGEEEALLFCCCVDDFFEGDAVFDEEGDFDVEVVEFVVEGDVFADFFDDQLAEAFDFWVGRDGMFKTRLLRRNGLGEGDAYQAPLRNLRRCRPSSEGSFGEP